MCFVEFDNVDFATAALFKLYGTHLSYSTKGGIRLSYSKNPLGVRPNRTVASNSASNVYIATNNLNTEEKTISH